MATFFRDNSIGTDPTNIPVIENLDVVPKSQKPKDKKEPLKKVVFTIVVILLMLGVGGGLYYYLNLGQKNKTTSNFTLNDIEINQGQVLSSNITDYGNFNGIDTSLCNLDLSSVDINEVGSYSYSVKCFKTMKQGIIKVISFNNFKVTTKILTRKVGASVTAKNFVDAKDGYTYSFVNSDDYASLQKVGLRTVPIDVKDNEDKHQTVYGILNVLEKDFLMMLDCKKDNSVQRVVFDYNRYKMGNVIDIYETVYSNEEELIENAIKIKDGILTINNHTGFALVDYNKLQIRLFSSVDDSSLSSNFPKIYDDIRNYYINGNYNC